MFVVYIIRSESRGIFYVGHTEDLEQRIEEHNGGRSHYTKGRGPWEVVYREEVGTRSAAMKREAEIKGRKSKRFIERLVSEYRVRVTEPGSSGGESVPSRPLT